MQTPTGIQLFFVLLALVLVTSSTVDAQQNRQWSNPAVNGLWGKRSSLPNDVMYKRAFYGAAVPYGYENFWQKRGAQSNWARGQGLWGR
ncbi:hypothetical protein M3Y98_00498800 [Aphelenchoides besseyi]|nr:hypothetical protein M3Y98_00498800 [Aphelenchoides besseyi]KAI6207745.1 hypothetical protein M3Y96_00041300 [Aphelenchoides besseyi]